MFKFVLKCLIVMFIFTYIVTLMTEQNNIDTPQLTTKEDTIITSSADHYSDLFENNIIESEPIIVDRQENKSFTFHIAQWIERSGLMIYDGIITIVTDLANLV